MMKSVPVRELRERLSELLTAVVERREHVVITRRGRPAAVLVPPDEYAALEETLDIVSDPASLNALLQGLTDDPDDDVDLDELRSELQQRSA
jgi:antitoxin YefM